jgi:hypothetical protein
MRSFTKQGNREVLMSLSKLFCPPTIVAVLAAALLATPPHLCANVIYPNLPPGSEYQLLFVTSGVRDGTSTDIADYNAFVSAQAALNPSLPDGISWTAVASTAAKAARDNATNAPGIPVYNTAGMLLSNSASGLYATFPLLAAPAYDENGVLGNGAVWSGSMDDGTISRYPLGNVIPGSESVGVGNSNNTRWLFGPPLVASERLSLYALSSPITVPVPEPSTCALVGVAVVGVAAVLGRRKLTCAFLR